MMIEKEMESHAAPYVLDEEAVHKFAAKLRGELITPAAANYDEARTIYNAMIDKRPSLMARCENVTESLSYVANSKPIG